MKVVNRKVGTHSLVGLYVQLIYEISPGRVGNVECQKQGLICLQSEKTCLQILNSVLGQLSSLCILNVNRPVFLIVI